MNPYRDFHSKDEKLSEKTLTSELSEKDSELDEIEMRGPSLEEVLHPQLQLLVSALQASQRVPLCRTPSQFPFNITPLTDQHPVYLIKNLASPEECTHLIQIGTPLLKPSPVVERDRLVVRDYRTSWTGYLTSGGKPSSDPILSKILQRIVQLSGCSLDHFEGVNIVRYEEGQKYSGHYDYFNTQHTKSMGPAGQRVLTFFLYLNTLSSEQGGATWFPKLNLKIQPQMGDCAFWINTSWDGQTVYPQTFHSGQPVQSGIKYASNIWIRQNAYP